MGRKTKYSPKYPEQAYQLCAEAGFNNTKLIKFFGISWDTLARWKKKYPELKAMIQKGLDAFAVEVGEKSLLQLVKGGRFKEETKELLFPELIKRLQKDSSLDHILPKIPKDLYVTTKIVWKKIQPNPSSVFYLLGNRAPERWRSVNFVEHSGKDGKPIESQMKLVNWPKQPETVDDFMKFCRNVDEAKARLDAEEEANNKSDTVH